MGSKRSKTLHLRRAFFNEGFNSNLENVLTRAFEKLPVAYERVVSIDLFEKRAFVSLQPLDSGGVVLRVFDYEDGATGAINLETTDVAAAIEEFEHPENKKFLKAQAVVLVDTNHLFCCDLGNKARTFGSNVLQLSHAADVLSGDVRMEVSDVPNKIELEKINEIGVKMVHFGLTNYLESLDLSGVGGAQASPLKWLLGKKHSDQAVRRRAAMVGHIHLSKGKLRPDEVEKDQWLTQLGELVISSDQSDSYIIELENNVKVKPEQIRVSKSVKLSRHANTYSYEQAVDELEQFRAECRRDGSAGF